MTRSGDPPPPASSPSPSPNQGHGHEHAHDHAHGAGEADCMADALRAEIAAQIAAQAAGESIATEPVEACPMPSEATDFLHWPWLWRIGQFLFVLALAWSFWPAAEKVERVLLYLATAATMAGSWVQMAKSTGGAPVRGSWLSRWRQAVNGWPEKFCGPLWILTALAIGAGFYIAGHGAAAAIDPANVGRSLNAFVEKADMLLIGLVGFVQFRFTASRRQPFWLMGLIAESWLIGLSALCAIFVGAYALRTGWPSADVGAELPAALAGPLSGWSTGYGTAFAHLAVVAVVLAAARAGGDPLWWTSRADPVTAARIKATRLVLVAGNLVLAVVAVRNWQSAPVHLEAIGWPDLEQLHHRTSTVYAQAFGQLPAGAVTGALVGCLGVFAVLTWRALGQRLRQMPARPATAAGDPLREAAAGWAEFETAPSLRGRLRAWLWMVLPLAASALALAATQKKGGWLVAAAAVVALLWCLRHAREAMTQSFAPAPESGPPAPRRRGLHPGLVLLSVVLLTTAAAWLVHPAALATSQNYRAVWWRLACDQIAQAPGGHGFGTHIFRAEFQRTYVDSPTGAATLQAAIPEALQPHMEPGWGPRDLAFHQKWLTWELSKGFDTHSVLLQALFEGGYGWLAILAAAVLTGLFVRGGFRSGVARSPSVALDLLLVSLVLLCLVDVASGNLEKMAACIMAAWVAWAPLESGQSS